jgi:SsrA-binding protein
LQEPLQLVDLVPEFKFYVSEKTEHKGHKRMGIKVVANNRKASHDFFLLDKYEAGLVLTGSEIKSVRAGRISLAEAYVTIEKGEAWLMDAHIAPYNEASSFNHEPRRPRKLLLHRKEIAELDDEISKKGMTVVPLKVYLKDGLAKVEIAIAKGKKLYDKRQAIAKRDAEREMERHLHERK